MANKQVRPRISEEEYDMVLRRREGTDHESLAAYCKENGIPLDQVSQYWHKGEHFSVMTKTSGATIEGVEEALARVLENHQFDHVDTPDSPISTSEKALKVTITDEHIGMDALYGNSLFQYDYNKEAYARSMEKVIVAITKEYKTHGKFDVLFIDSLGDQPDGWGGHTTRGGHVLPQNMTNAEMFETCVETRLSLIQSIVAAGVCDKIVLRCVSDDNHGGSFSLIVNKALQLVVNKMYDSNTVEVDIIEKFMEHRFYGDHCFVLTHGKDSTHMNRGMPLQLTDRVKNFITEYIDHHKITSPYIHVEKGDLHQLGYERTKKFDYRNFGSFAPPSSWVQMNFGDTYSCFSIQVVPKHSSEISHTDYFLDYKKIPVETVY